MDMNFSYKTIVSFTIGKQPRPAFASGPVSLACRLPSSTPTTSCSKLSGETTQILYAIIQPCLTGASANTHTRHNNSSKMIHLTHLPRDPRKPVAWHSSMNTIAPYCSARSQIPVNGATSPSIEKTPSVTTSRIRHD